jgi:hypothetical protein
MELYRKYQPATWYIGIIGALPDAVVPIIHPLYIPDNLIKNINHATGPIDEALQGLEPLAHPFKYLLVETKDGRTTLFCNGFLGSGGASEMPTWMAGDKLGVRTYIVRNVPNTISKDQKTGCWGSRVIEFREPEVALGVKPPTFGIHVTNDAGKWHFYRYGEKQSFENEKAYKFWRKPERFTVEMLVEYCRQLHIPVYDREFYSNKYIIIEEKARPGRSGISYQEAALKFRIV